MSTNPLRSAVSNVITPPKSWRAAKFSLRSGDVRRTPGSVFRRTGRVPLRMVRGIAHDAVGDHARHQNARSDLEEPAQSAAIRHGDRRRCGGSDHPLHRGRRAFWFRSDPARNSRSAFGYHLDLRYSSRDREDLLLYDAVKGGPFMAPSVAPSAPHSNKPPFKIGAIVQRGSAESQNALIFRGCQRHRTSRRP